MKSLPLANSSFIYLEKSFGEWLDIVGYAPTSVYYMPLHIRELLHYLEKQGIIHISGLKASIISTYYNQLKERANARRGGSLSASHLNKHLQALRCFTEYLSQSGRVELEGLRLQNEADQRPEAEVLSVEQVQLLFAASYKQPLHKPKRTDEFIEALQYRDRAMLAVYYGCGLRRNEGVQLNITDIDFDTALLYVRKGKGYKERFVPISKGSLKHLQSYVYDYRAGLLCGGKSEALFVSDRGARVQGQSLYLRLKLLQYQSEDIALSEKDIGLHTLRHSIATHLLQGGMELEDVQRFLGHDSIESTQIYTHIAGIAAPQQYTNIPFPLLEKLHEDEYSPTHTRSVFKRQAV